MSLKCDTPLQLKQLVPALIEILHAKWQCLGPLQHGLRLEWRQILCESLLWRLACTPAPCICSLGGLRKHWIVYGRSFYLYLIPFRSPSLTAFCYSSTKHNASMLHSHLLLTKQFRSKNRYCICTRKRLYQTWHEFQSIHICIELPGCKLLI